MAALPRLSARAEHRFLRVACGLPAGVQRLVFGRPTARDGQVLESDIHALLRVAAMGGDTSVTGNGQRSLERARAENRRGAAALAGPPLPLARVEQREVPGPGGTIPARLYIPKGVGEGPRPLLVYYHGGGWVLGDLDTHDSAVRFLAATAGVAVLSVEYRLAPEHRFPHPVEDAFAAFEWAAENAVELGADPARIAVGGDSAGGNLAAAVSILARDGGGASPAMQLLIYPVTDAVGGQESRHLFADGFLLTAADMDWFEENYLPDAEAGLEGRASVLRVENLSGLAPAYIATAGFDPLRDEGEAYAERMREAGVRVACRRHAGQVHGFANMTAVSRSSRAAMSEVAGALRMGLA